MHPFNASSKALATAGALLALAAALAGCGDSASGGKSLSGEVIRAVDGDTIVVRLSGQDERVRYIGIDTPETVAPGRAVGCFGPEASHANQQLVEGQQVRLLLDAEQRDRYGRLLAYVYVERAGGEELFVNADLVARGFATARQYPPNTRHAAQFERLALRARSARRGLWLSCRR